MMRKVAASMMRYYAGPIILVGRTVSRACTDIPSCEHAVGIPVLGGSGRLHKTGIINFGLALNSVYIRIISPVYVFDIGL